MNVSNIKKKILKCFIIITVSISLLSSDPTVIKEIDKMLAWLSGIKEKEIKEQEAADDEAGQGEKIKFTWRIKDYIYSTKDPDK